MIDIHSHILHGMDDGAISLGETIDMLRIASYEGIDTIIATPEYRADGNIYTREELLNGYQQTLKVIKKENIPINLLLGNELCMDYTSWNKIVDMDYLPLGNSRYLLITLPKFICKYTMDSLIYTLCLKGYTPIISQPERGFALTDQSIVSDLIKNGCLVQLNAGSITGMYGHEVMKVAFMLLKHRMVHFVATDAHSSLKNSPRLKEAYAIVSHRFGKRYAQQLFDINGSRVANNQIIDPTDLAKKRLFQWIKRLMPRPKSKAELYPIK